MAAKKRKVTNARKASRDLIPKSFQWRDYSFQWIRHKRAFRVVHKTNGFVGWAKGTADEAKSAAVAFQLRQLVDSVERAVESIDKMQECLTEHRQSLQIEIADARSVLERTEMRLQWAPNDVEPDDLEDDA